MPNPIDTNELRRSSLHRLAVVCCASGLMAFLGGSASRASVTPILQQPADNPSQTASFRIDVQRPLLLVPCEQESLRLDIEVNGEINCVDRGTVESECRWSTPILEVIESGTEVKKGDVVVTLDSSDLVARAQRYRLYKVDAQAALNTSRERLVLQKLLNESRLADARLKLRLAELDLRSFRDGEMPRAKSAQAGTVELAREAVANARENYDYQNRLADKGYVSASEVESARMKLRKAEYQLDMATDALGLLEEHVEARTLFELEAKLQRCRDELTRAEAESELALHTREIDVVTREKRFNTYADYLDRVEAAISACEIRAPRSGRVVVARPTASSQRNRTLAAGDTVYNRQAVFDIPRFDSLEVTLNVHETNVRHIEPGQRVEIRVDARPDDLFEGEVVSIASVPKSGTYPNYDLKLYPTVVRIKNTDGSVSDLRPGLTAKAVIIADEREDCRAVPAQSVVSIDGETSVFVADEGGTVTVRPVEIGLTTSTRVEIRDGLENGEQLVLSPKTELSEELVQLWKMTDETL